jgi:hypothetical protein
MSGAMRRKLTNAQVLPPAGVGQIRLSPGQGRNRAAWDAPPGCDHPTMTVASRRRGACTLVVLAFGAAGCGSDGSDSKRAQATPRPKAAATPPASESKPASESDEAVIRGWADALRAGRVAEASHFFAIPSVVSNGTPPVRLRSRSDVVFFNTALPCGARVTKTEDRGTFVVATFRLTERAGAGICGSGVGGTAQTAFEIRDGKIVQWRRVVEGAPDEAPGEAV